MLCCVNQDISDTLRLLSGALGPETCYTGYNIAMRRQFILIGADEETCIPFLCLLVVLKSQNKSEERHHISKM